jgi:hypothetical protein
MMPKSEIALHDYIQDQLGKPFEFGYNDCPLFVAGAIDAMKGTELRHIQTGDVIVMEQRLAHEKKWRSVAVCIGSKVAIVRDDIGVEIVNIFKVPNITEVLRWQ